MICLLRQRPLWNLLAILYSMYNITYKSKRGMMLHIHNSGSFWTNKVQPISAFGIFLMQNLFWTHQKLIQMEISKLNKISLKRFKLLVLFLILNDLSKFKNLIKNWPLCIAAAARKRWAETKMCRWFLSTHKRELISDASHRRLKLKQQFW